MSLLKVGVIIVIGIEYGGRLKERVGNGGGGGTLQERTESGVSFQNIQGQKEDIRSSDFKHNLLFLTLLIIFGFYDNKISFF